MKTSFTKTLYDSLMLLTKILLLLIKSNINFFEVTTIKSFGMDDKLILFSKNKIEFFLYMSIEDISSRMKFDVTLDSIILSFNRDNKSLDNIFFDWIKIRSMKIDHFN